MNYVCRMNDRGLAKATNFYHNSKIEMSLADYLTHCNETLNQQKIIPHMLLGELPDGSSVLLAGKDYDQVVLPDFMQEPNC